MQGARRRVRRWEASAVGGGFAMSAENLDSLHRAVPSVNFEPAGGGGGGGAASIAASGRPIAYSRYPHRVHRQKRPMPQNADFVKQAQPKGIIFVWPQRKNFYYEREYAAFVRFLSQTFYWLDMIGLFPSGKGAPIERPPWTIDQPLPKPENRDYIIEPDWNSVYA